MIERLALKYGENAPIFADDILATMREYTKARVYQLIAAAIDAGQLVRFDQGIYYIPTKTIFGPSKLNVGDVIERLYLRDGNKVYGFYSGLAVLNKLGITEQMPNVIEIVTNNESARIREVTIGKQKVILRKARAPINADNINVLQVLELMNGLKGKYDENDYCILRDYIDSTRVESPLRKVDDAVVLDNSNMSIEEQDAFLLALYEERVSMF